MLLAQSNKISEGEHRLQSPYCLWYSKKTNAQSFDQVKFLKKIISEHIQKIVQLFSEILNLLIFFICRSYNCWDLLLHVNSFGKFMPF